MKPSERTENYVEAAHRYFELLFHTTVRNVRLQSGGNPVLGLLNAISQVLAMVLIFYLLFSLLSFGGGKLRGDPFLFLISGIFLFFLHNQTISGVSNASQIAGGMMAHAPMVPSIVILAGALSKLYLFSLAAIVILTCYYLLGGSLEVDNPAGVALPILLAWASGIVVGLLMLSLKPFLPRLSTMISMVYQRGNMITSGKFFVGNSIPAALLPFFAWNPLFHCIDQLRGALFINYYPKNTSITYPLVFVGAGLVIGLMVEFWLRRTVSLSTGQAKS